MNKRMHFGDFALAGCFGEGRAEMPGRADGEAMLDEEVRLAGGLAGCWLAALRLHHLVGALRRRLVALGYLKRRSQKTGADHADQGAGGEPTPVDQVTIEKTSLRIRIERIGQGVGAVVGEVQLRSVDPGKIAGPLTADTGVALSMRRPRRRNYDRQIIGLDSVSDPMIYLFVFASVFPENSTPLFGSML
jgi:hypothetical protein